MKKGLTYLIHIVTTLLLYSCNDANNQMLPKEIDLIIDVDPSKAIENIKMSELYSDINYIPLETNDNSLIGNISDIIKYKDRFYILDNDITQSVFCFTETGNFLFKINRIGTGPGEYVKLAGFSVDIDNEQLLLYDNSIKQILCFSLDGDYIESHKIGFHAFRFSYISDGYFAFYNDFTMSNKDFLNEGTYPNLIITDKNFKVYRTGMEYSEDANFSAIPMLPQCFNRYDPKTLSLVTPLNDTIFHVSKVGGFPYLHINFKNNQREKEMNILVSTPDIEINAITDFVKDNSICDIFYFVESTQKVFFAYSKHPSTHYVFYDKESKDLKDIVFKQGKQFPIVNDIDEGDDFPMPMISDGNLFYSVITPDMLLEKKEEILAGNAPKKQSVLEMIDQISEDDNPIIAIIAPK